MPPQALPEWRYHSPFEGLLWFYMALTGVGDPVGYSFSHHSTSD
jgi:hypothetical protein